MLYPDEVNPLDDLDLPGDEIEVTEREEKMARQLIDSLTTDFEPDKYKRRVPRAGARAHRAEGRPARRSWSRRPPRRRPKVVDLMAALEASLAAVKKGKPADKK